MSFANAWSFIRFVGQGTMHPDFSSRRFTRHGTLMYVAAMFALAASTVSVFADVRSLPLPPDRESQGVSYVTGGITSDESNAIKTAMASYPLVVEVYHQASNGKNEYTASSTLTIADLQGVQRFRAKLEGPFALLRITPGRYDATVELDGHIQHKRLDVKDNGSTKAAFVFKD